MLVIIHAVTSSHIHTQLAFVQNFNILESRRLNASLHFNQTSNAALGQILCRYHHYPQVVCLVICIQCEFRVNYYYEIDEKKTPKKTT